MKMIEILVVLRQLKPFSNDGVLLQHRITKDNDEDDRTSFTIRSVGD